VSKDQASRSLTQSTDTSTWQEWRTWGSDNQVETQVSAVVERERTLGMEGLVVVDGKKGLTTSAFAKCPRGRSATLIQ
jgi:hypothetical protein